MRSTSSFSSFSSARNISTIHTSGFRSLTGSPPLGIKSIVLPSHSGIVKIYKIDIDNKFVTFVVL